MIFQHIFVSVEVETLHRSNVYTTYENLRNSVVGTMDKRIEPKFGGHRG
jgi:hypothetical protein